MTTPTWPELIVLMCFGETEETPLTGTVDVDDSYGDGDGVWPHTVRVHKSGSRYRVEALDGTLLFIKALDRSWQFSPGSRMPVMVDFADDDERPFGSYGHVVERPDPTRWRGDDFTTPTGPPRRVTYLGRDAWEIELAPPAHKPEPVTLVIDATTGMQLRWGSEQFGDVFRWTSMSHDVELGDDLFAWDGPYVLAWGGDGDDLPDAVREDLRRAEAATATKAAALRLPDLELRLSGRPEVWEVGDDGSFSAMVDFDAFLLLERRPHEVSEWESDDPRPSVDWTDDGWDWRVRAPIQLTPADVASIRRQLAEPRPDQG